MTHNHPNWPVGTTELVFRDIVNPDGSIAIPAAAFKRSESWEYLGAGGVPETPKPQLIKLGEHNGLPLYVTLEDGCVATVIQAKSIAINGRFRLAQRTGESGPESWFWYFNPDGESSVTQEMTLKWNVPYGWRLAYILRGSSKPSIILFRDEFPRVCAIPALTNIFDDGLICMGYEWSDVCNEASKASPKELAELFQRVMDTAPWNADLIDSNNRKRRMEEYFRWSAETLEFIGSGDPPTVPYLNPSIQKIIEQL